MSFAGDNYFDQDDILQKWGFSENICHHCGIKNSDLNGLLMQCGKCKKAYYCGMKCFNADLPRHQNFCVTKAIQSEPSKIGFSLPSSKTKPLAADFIDDAFLDRPSQEKSLKKEKSFKKEKSNDLSSSLEKSYKKEKLSTDRKSGDSKSLKKEKSFKTEKPKENQDAQEKSMKKEKSLKKEKSFKKEKSNKKISTEPGNEENHSSEKEGKKTKSKKSSTLDSQCNSPRKMSHETKVDSDNHGQVVQGENSVEEDESIEEEWEESIQATMVTVQTSVRNLFHNSFSDTQDARRGSRILPSSGYVPDTLPNHGESVNLRKVEHMTPKRSQSDFPQIDLKKAPARPPSSRNPSVIEHVDLNYSEIQKREYDWELPDWVNPSLRQTELGDQIKTVGDIKDVNLHDSPEFKAKASWAKPEWAQKNILKSTGKGEMLKLGVDPIRLTSWNCSTGTKQNEYDPMHPYLNYDLSEMTDQMDKSCRWAKPEWVKKDNILRKTGILDQIKSGVDLGRGKIR